MPSKYTADAKLGGTESIEGVEATEKQQESLDCSQVDCYSIYGDTCNASELQPTRRPTVSSDEEMSKLYDLFHVLP